MRMMHDYSPDQGPQSYKDATGKMILCKGGGGGGSSATYYANQDKLLGVEAQGAQYMLDTAMPIVPGVMQNSQTMVNQAMDGTLAKQMSEQAGNNAQGTFGAALDANNRNMQRYGMQFDANRLLSEGNRNAIMGAANKAGAMNQANAAAEDAKWNRNAGLYSQATGMSSGAMSNIGQAASSYGASANSMNQSAAANAAGYGQAGAAFGSGMFKADGGYIKAPGLASGGDAWEAYKKANPVVASGPQSNGGGVNPYLAMAMGMAPMAAGSAVKDIFSDNSKIKKGLGTAYDKVKEWNKPTNSTVPAYAEDAPKAVVSGAVPAYAEEAPMQATSDVSSNLVQQSVDPMAQFGEMASWGAALPDSFACGGQVKKPGLKLAAGGDVENGFWKALVGVGPAEAGHMAGEAGMSDGDIAGTVLTGGAFNLFNSGGQVKKPGLKLAMGGIANPMHSRIEGVSNTMDDSPLGMRVAAPVVMPTSANAAKPLKVPTSSAGTAAPAQADPREITPGKAVGATEKTARGLDAADKLGDAQEKAKAANDALEAAKQGEDVADTLNAANDAAEAANAVDTASKGLDSAAGGNPITAGLKLGVDLASGRDAGEAVADAALTYGGAEAGAALGTMLIPIPGVGTVVGGVLGGLAGGSFFNQGGNVQGRADYTPGGKVRGPGTETSDDIPAWLSDGEFVLNAEAVKMIGKDKLDAINNKGLAMREGKTGLKAGMPALAGGGFLGGNMGIALGAAANEWNKQRQMDEDEKFRTESLKLQQNADARAADALKLQQSGEERQQKMYEDAKADRERVLKNERLAGFALKASELAKSGDLDALSRLGTEAYSDGYKHSYTKGADGNITLTRSDSAGNVVDSTSIGAKPEHVSRFVLANADPRAVLQWDRDEAKQQAVLARYDNEIKAKERMHKEAMANAIAIARINKAEGPNAGLQGQVLQASLEQKLQLNDMAKAMGVLQNRIETESDPAKRQQLTNALGMAMRQYSVISGHSLSGAGGEKAPGMLGKWSSDAQKRLADLDDRIYQEEHSGWFTDKPIMDGTLLALRAQRAQHINTNNARFGTSVPDGDEAARAQTLAAYEQGQGGGGGGGGKKAEGLRAGNGVKPVLPMSADDFKRLRSVDLSSNDPRSKLAAEAELALIQQTEREAALKKHGLRTPFRSEDVHYRPTF